MALPGNLRWFFENYFVWLKGWACNRMMIIKTDHLYLPGAGISTRQPVDNCRTTRNKEKHSCCPFYRLRDATLPARLSWTGWFIRWIGVIIIFIIIITNISSPSTCVSEYVIYMVLRSSYHYLLVRVFEVINPLFSSYRIWDNDNNSNNNNSSSRPI